MLQWTTRSHALEATLISVLTPTTCTSIDGNQTTIKHIINTIKNLESDISTICKYIESLGNKIVTPTLIG